MQEIETCFGRKEEYVSDVAMEARERKASRRKGDQGRQMLFKSKDLGQISECGDFRVTG